MSVFSCEAQEESRYTYRIQRILKEEGRELQPLTNSTDFDSDDFATNETDIDISFLDESGSKSAKTSKTNKSTKAPSTKSSKSKSGSKSDKSTKAPSATGKSTKAPSQSKSSKSTKAPSEGGSKSTKAPSSKSVKVSSKSTKAPSASKSAKSPTAKSAKSSVPTSKSSKASSSDDTRVQTGFTGSYVGLAGYSKSCSSQGGCIKDIPAFCAGGLDVVQEFDVDELGPVQVSMDITWDFARSPSTCATITGRSDSLEGLGWIPIRASNSFRCYTEPITRLPFSPTLDELFFSGSFSVKIMAEDDRSLPGQILSGAVCELFNSEGTYTGVNSFLLVAIVPGYLVTLEFDYDDNSLQVLPLINGTPQITLTADDSFKTGRWDQLLQQQQSQESLIIRRH